MREERIAFVLRLIHNRIKSVIHNSAPRFEKGPRSQLQGGILGYLYHHRDGPVYQKDLEKEFGISRATATNALRVMERDGFIVRKAQDRDGRLKRIQMTEEACQNHRQIEAHMDLMDRRMVEGMTQEEKEELHRLLGILLANLERMTEELKDSGGDFHGGDSQENPGPEQRDQDPEQEGCGLEQEDGGKVLEE